MFFLIGVSELAKRDAHLSHPGRIFHACSYVPNTVPIHVKIKVSDMFQVNLLSGSTNIEFKSCLLIFVTVQSDPNHVSSKIIPSAKYRAYFFRLVVVTSECHKQVTGVIEDIDLCRYRGVSTLIRNLLNKISMPQAFCPADIIQNPVNLGSVFGSCGSIGSF